MCHKRIFADDPEQPEGPIKAKLVFVHGYSDHINRYNAYFGNLAKHGIQTFAWDQRGWGRSALKKADWGMTGPTTQVVADVAAFVKDKLSVSPDVPLFVLGHSMGGGEVCTLMADPKYEDLVGQVRGWILEAPFIGFTPGAEPSSIKVILGRLAGKLMPNQQMKNVIAAESLSRDPAVVESIKNDELCHDTGTLEGLASMLDRTSVLSSGTMKVGKHVQALWLAHGTKDQTCSLDAAKKWLEQQTNVEDRSTKLYEDAYHQLHDDYCKEEFTADTVDWIIKRCGQPSVEAKL